VPPLASEGNAVAEMPKNMAIRRKSYFSVMWPQLRRNGAVNNVSKPSPKEHPGKKHGSLVPDFVP
jgi:hypothetical protein